MSASLNPQGLDGVDVASVEVGRAKVVQEAFRKLEAGHEDDKYEEVGLAALNGLQAGASPVTPMRCSNLLIAGSPAQQLVRTVSPKGAVWTHCLLSSELNRSCMAACAPDQKSCPLFTVPGCCTGCSPSWCLAWACSPRPTLSLPSAA